VIFTSQASYRCTRAVDEEDDISTGKRFAGKSATRGEKIRVIVMSNYLILDPEVFGPAISSWAGVILCNDSEKSDTHTLSRPRGVWADDQSLGRRHPV